MKALKFSKINYFLLALLAFTSSCKKDYGDLNNPTLDDNYIVNASPAKLNNLVTGTESGIRNSVERYLNTVGVIGREAYLFTDPRYDLDLLGFEGNVPLNSNFYIVDNWSAKYRAVKNANILIDATNGSSYITLVQKKAYLGFAKTIKAYQLLLNLNLTYTNGIRVDVADRNKLGPIVNYTEGLNAIAALLNEGKADLTGSTVSFPLSTGFTGFNDAAGLLKFNRALAARVAAYRKDWAGLSTALQESFLSLNGDLNTGVKHVYNAAAGDVLNPVFVPLNTAKNRTAHPSYATDIEAGDDRIAKAPLRTSATTANGLTGNRDIWIYTSATAPVPIIRNEELILLYAEAKIQSNTPADLIEAKTTLDIIRTKHNLLPYTGVISKDALVDELLKQRRYSLFFEGHRWIDVRRYEKLSTLPKDRPNDDVWDKLPLPASEQ